MFALEIIAGIVLLYTSIVMLVLHTCKKSTRRRYLVTFLVWDLLFVGVAIAMISIYSFAGVPNNCSGMTRANYGPGDAPDDPAPGFTTVRFGQGLWGSYGELDIYCDIPRVDYAFCVLLIFSYILSIVLAMFRILSPRYTQNTDIEKLCEEAEAKGKKAFSDAASSTRASLHHTPTPTRSNITSTPISPVSSFHPADEDEADPRISDGSRGEALDGARDPPPYMPDAVAGQGSVGVGNGTPLGSYGKDQNFPGLRN